MSTLMIRGGQVLEGELLRPAILDAQEMAYMNFARSEHRKLEHLVRQSIIPMLGGYESDLAKELDRHLEQTRTFSGNFCWKHRHVGASHGVVGAGDGV